MGIRRNPEELKSEIISGTVHIIAVGGMENFSFPKLTAKTGISAPTVYEHYKNKEELLTTCFFTVDREIAYCIDKAMASYASEVRDDDNVELQCMIVWQAYWNYLVSNAEKTIFYRHFFDSNYFTHEVQKQHRENFGMIRDIIDRLNNNFLNQVKCDTDMLAAHMINATAAYASKMLRGYYKNDKSTEETVYHMVFQPIYATLRIRTGEMDYPKSTKIHKKQRGDIIESKFDK